MNQDSHYKTLFEVNDWGNFSAMGFIASEMDPLNHISEPPPDTNYPGSSLVPADGRVTS